MKLKLQAEDKKKKEEEAKKLEQQKLEKTQAAKMSKAAESAHDEDEEEGEEESPKETDEQEREDKPEKKEPEAEKKHEKEGADAAEAEKPGVEYKPYAPPGHDYGTPTRQNAHQRWMKTCFTCNQRSFLTEKVEAEMSESHGHPQTQQKLRCVSMMCPTNAVLMRAAGLTFKHV